MDLASDPSPCPKHPSSSELKVVKRTRQVLDVRATAFDSL